MFTKRKSELYWDLPEIVRMSDFSRRILVDEAVKRVDAEPTPLSVIGIAFIPAVFGVGLLMAWDNGRNSLIWFVVWPLTFVLSIGSNRRRRRWRVRMALKEILTERQITPNHCFACGYDLRGTHSEECPECGEQLIVPRAPDSREAVIDPWVQLTRTQSER